MKRAVIDIGTNSVKLLVAEVEGHEVHPLLEQSEQTRLGQGFYESNQLQERAIALTAQAVAHFVHLAREHGIETPRIIATSAARDATNQSEFKDAIYDHANMPVEIITGEQEAELAFQGVTSDPKLDGKALLILDVGGGSTEMIGGERGHHSLRQSFPLGSVRLMEKLRPDDPPTLEDLAGCRHWLATYFRNEVSPTLETFLTQHAGKDLHVVGTGGTTTILARIQLQMSGFERERIDGLILTRQQVLETMVDLWSQPLAQRKKIVGLPPNRADIILMGVAIYEAVITQFRCENLHVSTRGLRFGAVLGA